MRGSFDGTPLVAGSVTGLRTFNVRKDGTLVGVAQAQVFRSGVNHARCLIGGHHMITNHKIGGLNCTCGFYAFYNGSNEYMPEGVDYSDFSCSALIEGFGTVTIGDRGFRAERAQLVALVLPVPKSRWNQFLFRHRVAIMLAVGVLCGISTALPMTVGTAWAAIAAAALSMVALSVSGLTLWAVVRVYRPPAAPGLVRRVPLVRAMYPGVPIYPTVKAALAAHPITRVEDLPARPIQQRKERRYD